MKRIVRTPGRVTSFAALVLLSILAAYGALRRPPAGDLLLLAGLLAAALLSIWLAIRGFWGLRVSRLLEAVNDEEPTGRAVMSTGADELGVLHHAINRQRRRAQSALLEMQRERDTLRNVLRELLEGVIVVDAGGRIALLNPAAARLLNLREDCQSLQGDPLEEAVPQHDVQRLLRAPLSSDGEAEQPPMNIVVENAAGRTELAARAGALRIGDSAQLRFVVLTDVTALSDALKMKADFVANASHELRTPLATIRAAIETLQHMDLAAEGEDAARFLELIDRHSGRLSDLVSDLLDLSRIESPEVAHPLREIDLPAALAELRERFSDKCRERRVQLETQVPSSAAEFRANPYLLQLILDNLVDNAVKFSQADSRVRVIATALPEHVRIEVIDSGCGIPEADRKRVFERFYQVERARTGATPRGSGLGLAIVKHSTNVLGGTVGLRSRVGVGTTVTVVLPRNLGPTESLDPAPRVVAPEQS